MVRASVWGQHKPGAKYYEGIVDDPGVAMIAGSPTRSQLEPKVLR